MNKNNYEDEVICRGSWLLGTACGLCKKCKETKPKFSPDEENDAED